MGNVDLEFDFVVVGAGSAGCVIASRLAEAGSNSICLIEAGRRDRNPWIHIPLGFGKVVPDPRMNWGYQTEPEPHLNGRRIGWPRGKVLGGSGSINGMVFLRGSQSDFDNWEALGARGWGYKNVLPYFKKMEHNVRGADAYRGTGGPIVVSDIKRPSRVARAFVEACKNLQFSENQDFNGERLEGIGFVQLNVRNGWRCSTASGYLRPNLSRSNLKLFTNSLTLRVLFDGRRAVGVEVNVGEEIKRIRARKEVVLSGGAVNSPILLMLSGIGPAEELSQYGIEVLRNAPEVGKNLQDHVHAKFTFLTREPGTLNEILTSIRQQARMGMDWLLSASGQLAVGVTEAVLFARSDPSEVNPDLEFQCYNFSAENIQIGLDKWPGFTVVLNVCRPKSRGEIRLADANPRSKPRIFANYFSDEDDMRRTILGIRIARRIKDTEPFHSLVYAELRPGPDVQTDQQIETYVRQAAGTVFHPCGTCRMGEDDSAVVDSELRVRGVDGLRVIDASVMPAIPSPNIHPATIMVAERGADLLLRN